MTQTLAALRVALAYVEHEANKAPTTPSRMQTKQKAAKDAQLVRDAIAAECGGAPEAPDPESYDLPIGSITIGALELQAGIKPAERAAFWQAYAHLAPGSAMILQGCDELRSRRATRGKREG